MTMQRTDRRTDLRTDRRTGRRTMLCSHDLASRVRHDGEVLVDQVGWCRMPQHATHPNGSISEQIEAVGASPDPVVYQSNST